MQVPIRVVVVGASDAQLQSVVSALGRVEYDCDIVVCDDVAAAHATVMADASSIVLLFDPGDSFAEVLETSRQFPVVVLGCDSEERAAMLLQAGAEDCLPTSNLARLSPVVARWFKRTREHADRSEIEAQLARVQEQYREHVENANDVVFTIDLSGTFTSFNRAGEVMSGYGREEIHHLNMAQVLAPESLEVAGQMIRQKLVDNRPTVYDLVLIAKDGEHIPLEVSTRLLCHDDTPVGVQGIARDVRERKRAEKEAAARVRRQAAVTKLQQEALATSNVSKLFDVAVESVVSTLGVDLCSIVETLPDRSGLIGRAGYGWQADLVKNVTVGPRLASQAGFTLLEKEPVVVLNMAEELRFSVPEVLTQHGVTSGASVRIERPESPFGVLGAFSRTPRHFTGDEIHFLGEVANVLGTAVERARLEGERNRHSLELATRVLQAQEEERKRISRELHDETLQALSALFISLDLLQSGVPVEESTLQSGFVRMKALTKRILDGVRALSHDLRPTMLDDVGLVAALQWFAEECERIHGGTFTIEAAPLPDDALSPEVQLAIFRIAQEAMNNAGKHAEAGNTSVSLVLRADTVRLTVEDDGHGFDLSHVRGPTREGRLGLYGMAERAALLGGKYVIATAPGNGTKVTLEVPIAESPLQGSMAYAVGSGDGA